jgi:hypothetical protein
MLAPPMTLEHREVETANVVAVGPFNPSIFQPFWLAKYGLVPEAEAEAAKVDVVHSDITSIRVGPFTIQVERQRAIFEVSDVGYLGPLKDLVLGIAQLLPHVQTGAVGLNRHMHFRVKSKIELDRLGFMLVPPEPWRGMVEQPEMRVLAVWGRRTGVPARVQIQVEPSAKVVPGLAVSVNEEHVLGANSTLVEAMEVIHQHFDPAFGNAVEIGAKLARMTKAERP